MRDYCWSPAGTGLGCDPEKRQKSLLKLRYSDFSQIVQVRRCRTGVTEIMSNTYFTGNVIVVCGIYGIHICIMLHG